MSALRAGAARVAGSRLPVVQLVLLGALFVYGSATIDGFAQAPSLRSMLVLATFLGIAAAGQTLVILLGGIDLSTPFLIGAANVLAAELTGGRGWPLGLAIAFIAVLALTIGALNGWLSHRFAIHPLIVTLGTGSMAVGGVLVWTQARLTGAVPGSLSDFVSPAQDTWFLPVPPVVVFWAALTVVVTVALLRTRAGRRLYAVGASPPAARLALVRTTRVWTGAFAVSALASAGAGILLAGFSGTGLFTIGDPYLFTSIAAVVLGGTSLRGARGDYVRTAIGALILILTTTIMVGKGISAPGQQVILGVLILIFVTSYGREPHVRTRV
jgi:ribose transport system permease protein